MRILPWVAVLQLVVVVAPASAVVTIGIAPRTELLYSAEEPDCTMLSKTADELLPFHVVRLRALVDGAEPDQSVRLRWSLRRGFGSLAADVDLSPPGDTPLVSGVCADFGNDCILAAERLRGYVRSTILYVAPSCAGANRPPDRSFRGEEITVRLKAFAGRRRIGRADVKFGVGRIGSATLFVQPTTDATFKDGVGDSNGVSTVLNPIFGAIANPPDVMPGPVESYRVSGDLGSGGLGVPCRADTSLHACSEILLTQDRGTMTLTAAFADGSALCDNIGIVVLKCAPNPELSVIQRPSPGRYRSQTVVRTIVRLKNASTARDGLPPCPFLLRGGSTLTCVETLKAGKIEDTQSTSFGLPFCSMHTDQDCRSDSDCRPPRCPNCEPDERCLLQPFCSETTDRPCQTDADCRAPACPNCERGEFCHRRLGIPDTAAFLLPGDSIDLLTSEVLVRNRLKATAFIRDVWTVRITIPPLTVSKAVKYQIAPGKR